MSKEANMSHVDQKVMKNQVILTDVIQIIKYSFINNNIYSTQYASPCFNVEGTRHRMLTLRKSHDHWIQI